MNVAGDTLGYVLDNLKHGRARKMGRDSAGIEHNERRIARDSCLLVGKVGVGTIADEVVQSGREVSERVGHLTGVNLRFCRCSCRQSFLQQKLAWSLARCYTTFIYLAYCA